MVNLEISVPARRADVRQRKAKPAYRQGYFEKGGKAGPGRPKGVPDRFTREIKQALLDAVEYVGEEKAGEYLAALKQVNANQAPIPISPAACRAFALLLLRGGHLVADVLAREKHGLFDAREKHGLFNDSRLQRYGRPSRGRRDGCRAVSSAGEQPGSYAAVI
jgi:hypothetical protein